MLIKGNDDKKIGKKACGISGLPLLGAVTEWQLLILQQLTLPLTIGCRQVFKKRELIIYKQRNSKKYFSNYRTCMGMLLQGMYGLHIQIIANFSATHDLIQKNQNDCFNIRNIGILFTKYLNKRSNIRATVDKLSNYLIMLTLGAVHLL